MTPVDSFVSHNSQSCTLGRHEWSVARLIQLAKELEPFDIPLKHLNIYYKYDSMSLREMVGHMKSVNKADLDYPIILDEDGEVMDGRHRIMKALIEGKESIKAVRFDKNPSPDRVND
jgi:hypothetical protein